MQKEELTEALRQRKSIGGDQEKTEGPEDIVEQLGNSNLIVEDDGEYRLSAEEGLADRVDTVLVYSGQEVIGAGDERAQADRVLANIMYDHPMLIALSKFVYRNSPVKKYELMREFDGESFLDDKMNQFTISMGLDLLEDAEVIEQTDDGFVSGRWPIRVFTHVLYEEYNDLEDGGSINESRLFERLEMMYGITKSTFDRHLSRLKNAGVVSEASYEELILNREALEGGNIHE